YLPGSSESPERSCVAALAAAPRSSRHGVRAIVLTTAPDFSLAPPTEGLGVARSRPQRGLAQATPARHVSCPGGMRRIRGSRRMSIAVAPKSQRTPCRHSPPSVVRPYGRQYHETHRALCSRVYLA